LQWIAPRETDQASKAVRALELISSAGDRFKQADPELRRQIIETMYSNSEFDGHNLRPNSST
jgi:hypothetical protein